MIMLEKEMFGFVLLKVYVELVHVIFLSTNLGSDQRTNCFFLII